MIIYVTVRHGRNEFYLINVDRNSLMLMDDFESVLSRLNGMLGSEC